MIDPIKEKIRVTNDIPDRVDYAIKETLQVIREQEKKVYIYNKGKKIIRVGLVSAFILMFSTITFAAVTGKFEGILKQLIPTAATNYDQLKVELGIEGEEEEQELKFRATPVTAEGITIGINELAYDGTMLIYKYKITTDRVDFPFELDAGKAYVYDIFVGDEKISGNMEIGSEGRQVSKNTYEGYGTVKINWRENIALDTAGELSFRVGEACSINGEWFIETNVTLEDIYQPPIVHEIDKQVTVEGLEVVVEKLIISSFSTQISYTIKDVDLNGGFHEPIRFFILDDKGNCLNYGFSVNGTPQEVIALEDGGIQVVEDTLYDMKNTVELMKWQDDINTLTFMPYKNYSYKSQGIDTLDIAQANDKLSINKNLEVIVSNIQVHEGKITFEYIFEGLNPEWMWIPFKFLDEKGIDITEDEGLNVVLDSETGKSYVTYITEHPDRVANIAVEKYFDSEVLKNQMFDVKLK